MEITELALCPECNNSLFSDSLKALTLLECGYVYHRLNFALHICRGIAYLNALGINNVRVTFLSKREFFHLFSLPCFECENIMVTESNLAKLANFGTSREKHDATTTIGSQPERVRWLAPEKLKDNGRRYDHKCENFSFGMNWLLRDFSNTWYYRGYEKIVIEA
ncbi:uncharacterized protein OCT59_007844 [Rhizophagus irregularis]|uniref:uncharacterized protein n=1 Tax=Rhizophagus irregularis TaxID=588596 RepID=UPI000CABCDAB|nr:hypothetical protein OCT59_007844 [Rhizophagus irregularis]